MNDGQPTLDDFIEKRSEVAIANLNKLAASLKLALYPNNNDLEKQLIVADKDVQFCNARLDDFHQRLCDHARHHQTIVKSLQLSTEVQSLEVANVRLSTKIQSMEAENLRLSALIQKLEIKVVNLTRSFSQELHNIQQLLKAKHEELIRSNQDRQASDASYEKQIKQLLHKQMQLNLTLIRLISLSILREWRDIFVIASMGSKLDEQRKTITQFERKERREKIVKGVKAFINLIPGASVITDFGEEAIKLAKVAGNAIAEVLADNIDDDFISLSKIESMLENWGIDLAAISPDDLEKFTAIGDQLRCQLEDVASFCNVSIDSLTVEDATSAAMGLHQHLENVVSIFEACSAIKDEYINNNGKKAGVKPKALNKSLISPMIAKQLAQSSSLLLTQLNDEQLH